MNRNLMIAVGILCLLLLVGMAYMMFFGSKKPESTSSKDSGVFSSIQDALMKSMSLECNYTSPEGVKTQAYIKDGMVRSEIKGETAEESGSVIINAKYGKIYFWNSSGGFVMAMPDTSASPSQNKDAIAGANANLAALEKYKNFCTPKKVSDTHFVLPNNIKFQDLSQIMPGETTATSGAKSSGKPPAASSGMNPNSMEEVIRHYQQTPR